jgi:hypothetical protein
MAGIAVVAVVASRIHFCVQARSIFADQCCPVDDIAHAWPRPLVGRQYVVPRTSAVLDFAPTNFANSLAFLVQIDFPPRRSVVAVKHGGPVRGLSFYRGVQVEGGIFVYPWGSILRFASRPCCCDCGSGMTVHVSNEHNNKELEFHLERQKRAKKLQQI